MGVGVGGPQPGGRRSGLVGLRRELRRTGTLVSPGGFRTAGCGSLALRDPPRAVGALPAPTGRPPRRGPATAPGRGGGPARPREVGLGPVDLDRRTLTLPARFKCGLSGTSAWLKVGLEPVDLDCT